MRAPPHVPPLKAFISEVKVSFVFAASVAAVASATAVAAHGLGISVVTASVEASAGHVAVVGLVPAFIGAWLFCAGRRFAFASAPKAFAVAAGAAGVGVVVHEVLLQSSYYVTSSPLSLLTGVRPGFDLVDSSGAWPVSALVVVGAGTGAALLHRWAARRPR
jgi:hypothetical protein